MTTTTQAEVAPATSNSRSFLLERVQPALSGLRRRSHHRRPERRLGLLAAS